MILLAYLGILLALSAAAVGAWMTVRSFSGEVRLIDRRLDRVGEAGEDLAVAPRAKKQTVETRLDSGQDEGPLARLVERLLPGLRRRLLTAGAPLTPVQVILGSLGLFAAMFLTLWLIKLPALLSLGLAAWGGIASPFLLISFFAARRRNLFTQQMPQAVDLIARSLQAGHPVTTAMGVAAQRMPDPIGPELGVVLSEMNAGLNRDAALRNLLVRFPIPELRMFTATLEVTRETGGNVAEVLLKLGEVMRGKAQLRKKVAAISAEGRMSFWVVSILPIVVAAVVIMLKPDYYGEVVSDPLFWPMMMGPPILWAIGALIIWRMINFKV